MIQALSEDPYGIFGLVISPTRELAVQIKEQFEALGAPISLRTCLVIGGVNMIEQGSNMAKRPHIVVGTPGRIRHHLEGADPPDFRKVKFLVLDEADRLLAAGFSAELEVILSRMSISRQTLLFSATMTDSLVEVQKLTKKESLRFDLISGIKVPSKLMQQYLFLPSNVKICYLFTLLMHFVKKDDEGSTSGDGRKRRLKRKYVEKTNLCLDVSMIIFVNTCKRCEEIKEILIHLNIDCVCLHSIMSQHARHQSLEKFKNLSCTILVATDVASRGLDIPSVDIVINLDVPKVHTDYIHRVGRTARARRFGRSITFVTQHDVEIIHEIEDYVGSKMSKCDEIDENHVVQYLNKVSKAMRIAKLKMLEGGFEDMANEKIKRRKKRV